MKPHKLAILILLPLILSSSASSQEEELEKIDRVEKLQKQLDSDVVAEKEQAEKQLIEMGPEILDYIQPEGADATTDYRERLARIRKSLEKTSVNSVANPSVVTVSGSMTVGDILKKIKRQTGNEVAVTDESILDKEIKVDWKKVEFWPAIEALMSQAQLGIDRYGSAKPKQLMLTPVAAGGPLAEVPTNTSRIFQTLVTRVDSSVNLNNPELDFTNVSLLVRWEPRLTPISVDIPLSKVQVIDEFGDKIALANPEQVVYGMVQPEIPEVEFVLQLPRVDRQVENIKSVKAVISAVLPGRSEQFRFNKVSKLKDGFELSKAGARVTYEGTRKNEDLYGVKMSISFEEENNALESHQSWVFQNEVYLQDNTGTREESISLETLRQDNERVTVQYYFLEDPGDRTLVYKTPATIVKLPVEIELQKIPLP